MACKTRAIIIPNGALLEQEEVPNQGRNRLIQTDKSSVVAKMGDWPQ